MSDYLLISLDSNHKFNYKDMRPVYTIILLEKSTQIFKDLPNDYIHKGECIFDTGLNLHMLQHYIYIPLDIFQKKTENVDRINTNLEAWLTLLSENNPKRILTLFNTFPDFMEIYQEIDRLRHNIKEAFSMFSDDLAVLDRNTQEYMVDEMQSIINKQESIIKENESIIKKKELESLRYNSLVQLLLDAKLTDDLRKTTTDTAFRDILYKKYNL